MGLCSFQDFRYAPTSTTRSGGDSFHPEMLLLTGMIGFTNQGIHPYQVVLYDLLHLPHLQHRQAARAYYSTIPKPTKHVTASFFLTHTRPHP